MKRFALGAITAFALVGTTAAEAHHSYAMFDLQKVVDIKGTVKEFHYTNPHSWIVLLAQDPSGKPFDATFEANGPGYLVRFGWKRNSLNPGDVITVSANPLRDGSPGGSLVKVTFPDGHELNGRPEFPPGAVPPPPTETK